MALPPLRHYEGYKRVADSRPNQVAVRWWYFAERDDGSCFARGGRVSSARAARRELRNARTADHAERRLDSRLERPVFVLQGDGSLRPVPR